MLLIGVLAGYCGIGIRLDNPLYKRGYWLGVGSDEGGEMERGISTNREHSLPHTSSQSPPNEGVLKGFGEWTDTG